ncbi:MAG: PIN domain-containing protein [Candidatus Brockarchaeota archaeon]|nr:PIN domain-containing protein [Candidatus Brockarchaeota archaeon]MBO3809078.1 PIN domain-containing protein [Candidatus Brockarchaeota archaeon]
MVADSYAWIEYFLGSDYGRILKDYIDTEELATPSIVLAEVARKYLREGVGEEDVVKRLNFIVASSIVKEIDPELSITAAKAYLELSEKAKAKGLRKPSLTDGIVLATGRTLKAKIVTGDEHFKRLDEVVYMG